MNYMEIDLISQFYNINKIDTLYKLRLFITDEIKSNKLINLHQFICNKNEIQQYRCHIYNRYILKINEITNICD